MKEKDALWNGILTHRYKNLEKNIFINDKIFIKKSDSIWWRYLVTLDAKDILEKNIFCDNIVCNLGEGENLAFWYSKWIRYQSLKEAFPDVFNHQGAYLLAL